MSADQSAVSLNTACELLTGNLVDESGQLTLLMDRGRIVNLHIRGRWRDHLDAASLAKLLVVLPAKHQMMSLTRALHDFNSQNLRPDKMQAATSVHALSGDDRADEIARAAAGVWNELWRRYEVVDWTQPTVDTGTVTSARRHVEVDISDERVLEVRLEHDWVSRVIRADLINEILSGLHAAYSSIEGRSSIRVASPFRDLSERMASLGKSH